MSFIYLIKNEDSNKYKIGVTKNDPSKRLKGLQTGSSEKLLLIDYFETLYPYRMEKMLHNRYMKYHVLGEWYELPTDIINNFEKECGEVSDMINVMLSNPFFAKDIK